MNDALVVPAVNEGEVPKESKPKTRRPAAKKQPKAAAKRLVLKPVAKTTQKKVTKRVTQKKVAKIRRPFPYLRVARLWAAGKTIESIARSIGRFEKSADDPLHSMRCFLHRMHSVGYKDAKGLVRKLPHRIKKAAVAAARKAGKKAAA
jgi:hypothetical protein